LNNQSATKAMLAEYSVEVFGIEGDLTSPQAIDEFINLAEKNTTGIDILYNNAALMTAETPLFNTPQIDYAQSFQVNLFSMIQICSFFAPKMKARGYGRIINVTSGIKDTPILDAYSVSKAAVDKYTRDLAVELAGSGVMVDPGWCRTALGGPNAFNDVTSVLPGALIPALLEKKGDEAPMGMLFEAQNYVGVKF